MGKRKLNESDNDYSSEDGSDDEGENEKSVLLNSQNESGSNKDEGSSGSVTGCKQDGDTADAGSCESGSEEEKETVVEAKVESVGSDSSETDQVKLGVAVEPVLCDEIVKPMAMVCSESVGSGFNAEENGHQDCNGAVSDKLDGAVSQASNIMSSEKVVGASKCNDMDIDGSLEHKASVNEETLPNIPALEEPLSFDTFNSAAELEVYYQNISNISVVCCPLLCLYATSFNY